MTYTVEVPTVHDVLEVKTAYPTVADESMRCAPVTHTVDLYPSDHAVEIMVAHQRLYVARDESHAIRGMAMIHPDGEVIWLTLPTEDSHAVMEALLDHFKDTTGVSPWGEVRTDTFRSHLLAHPKMSDTGDTVTWRKT